MKHYRPRYETLEARLALAVSNLDPTFGDGGLVIDGFVESPSKGMNAYEIDVLPDGRVLTAGEQTIDRLMPDGTRDLSLGGYGRIGNAFEIRGLAVQSDGKFVVAGGAKYSSHDYHVARYLSDGQLDTSFGSAGVAVIDLGEYSEMAYDVQVDWAGKIVVVGASGKQMGIVRLNSDGQLDSTFGDGGIVIAQFRDSEIAYQLQMLPNHQMLVAGTTTEDRFTGADYVDVFVARYNVNGSLDARFGQNGFQRIEFGPNPSQEQGVGLTLTRDGRILVVTNTAQTDMGIARLTSDGELDTTFSEDGKLVQLNRDGEVYSILEQPDGRILAQSGKHVTRYEANGAYDNTFLSATFDNGLQNAMALQSDGKVLLAGYYGYQFGVRRLTAAGQMDTSFGKTGVVALKTGSSDDLAGDSAVMSDGRIVVVGSSQYQLAVARYLPDGRPDPTFSGDGHRLIPMPSNINTPRLTEVVVQADGKIVAAGTVANYIGWTVVDDLVVIRLNANGTLDTTFSEDGIAITTIFEYGDDAATSLLIQPDGKIVLSAYTNWFEHTTSLLRFNVDGSLDTSFSDDGIATMATRGATIVDMTLQSDGRILAVGNLEWGRGSLLMTRFNANGSLDGTFGTNAKLVFPDSPVTWTSDMEVLPDGRFYVMGIGYAIERYFADGRRDDTYQMSDQTFFLKTDFELQPAAFYSRSLTTLSDGRLVLAGTVGEQSVVRVLRTDGKPDESFAGDGDWIDSGHRQTVFNKVHRLSGDRLLVTGTRTKFSFEAIDGDFLLAQFTRSAPPVVTTTLSLSAAGQVVLADRWSHDDKWRFARTDTEIIITDLSTDRRVLFTVNGLPEVVGSGTKQLRIPLTLLDKTRKPLLVSAGAGDDQLVFSDTFHAPQYGISIRGEAGSDALDLSAFTTPVSWVMSSVNSGSARPTGRGALTFTGIEKLFGSQKADTFRVIYQGNPELLSIHGGEGRDVLQINADQDMLVDSRWPLYDRYLVVGRVNPQTLAFRSIEVGQITTGANDNHLDLRNFVGELVVKAGAGNDVIRLGNATSIVYGEDGDDVVYGGYGDDVMRGGAGNDLLSGSYGNDRLFGDAGRDLLVGEYGTDVLFGGEDDDVLIGGYCAALVSPLNPATSTQLRQLWTSSSSFAERVAQLNTVGVGRSTKIRLRTEYESVSDDSLLDTYYGELGQDWFFFDPASESSHARAGLRDAVSGEQLNDLPLT